jgi:transketolase C-terminal domain/subunit
VRNAFAAALERVVQADDRVCLVLADLGWGVFDEVERLAPGRVINAGIAEQTMVGVAAGLAQAGKKAVAYSIAPFIASRAHDQVRVDVAAGAADVTLVGVGGGVAYGYLGLTHHAIDDLAAMRALPNMTVLAPCDPGDAAAATAAALALDGPVYLRLGKNGEPTLLPAGSPSAARRACATAQTSRSRPPGRSSPRPSAPPSSSRFGESTPASCTSGPSSRSTSPRSWARSRAPARSSPSRSTA